VCHLLEGGPGKDCPLLEGGIGEVCQLLEGAIGQSGYAKRRKALPAREIDTTKIEIFIFDLFLYSFLKLGLVLVYTGAMEHTILFALMLVIGWQPFANETKILLA
jgi:hypothetical protein